MKVNILSSSRAGLLLLLLLLVLLLSMLPSVLSVQRPDASIDNIISLSSSLSSSSSSSSSSNNLQPIQPIIGNGDTTPIIGPPTLTPALQQVIPGELERESESNATPGSGEWTNDGQNSKETDESSSTTSAMADLPVDEAHSSNRNTQQQQQQQQQQETDAQTDVDANPTASSQPLQTLKKLQQMLDETDYMTTTTRGDDATLNTSLSNQHHQQHHHHHNPNQNFIPEVQPQLQPPPMRSMNNKPEEKNIVRDTEVQQSPPPELPPHYLYQHDRHPDAERGDDQQQQQQLPVIVPLLPFEQDPQLPPAHPYQHQSPPQSQSPPLVSNESTTLTTTTTTPATTAEWQSLNNPQRQQQRYTQPPPQQQLQQQYADDAVGSLWTSKDRGKYKKMQQMQRRADEERRRLEQQLVVQEQQQQLLQHQHQQHGSSSDDEVDGMTDTDDGLGYTLPNLPVYMSDAEGESSDSGEQLQSPTFISPPLQQQLQQQQQYVPQQQQLQNQPLAPPPLLNWGYNQPPPDVFLPQQQQQRQQQHYGHSNLNGQQFPMPYHQQQQPTAPLVGGFGAGYQPYVPYYNPQQQQYSNVHQQLQQQPYANQQQQQHLYSNPQQQQQQQMLATQYAAAWGYPQHRLQVPPSYAQAATKVAEIVAVPLEQRDQQQLMVVAEVPTTLAEATSRINFDSIQKLSLLFVSIATLAYCAVSPRNLQPLSEYNRHFYDNLRLVALCTIVPLANFLLVCDARENDINSVITSFYTSFTVGYALAFVLEIVMTTVVRLGVFVIWERNIFKLSPKVPTLVLPWVLRESKYRPKRITLFAADFLSSCVASPIIEEYVKLKILQLSVRLPRNFQWLTKVSTASGKNSKRKRKRRVAEAAPKNPGDEDVTSINSYVTHMLAVSLGIKLCDSSRRILMYTKKGNSNKALYALLRGAFPIQELCGTMTALALAKRDVLGVTMAQWQMLLPAVLIHGMANLRGMKPLFKWNSATPWSEMQLSPWNADDDSTLPQLINKGFAKLMWLVLLGRVLGYCVKNYYLVSRQARKRTTTYAGKQAAFSAELAAAEMLKKTKDKK